MYTRREKRHTEIRKKNRSKVREREVRGFKGGGKCLFVGGEGGGERLQEGLGTRLNKIRVWDESYGR